MAFSYISIPRGIIVDKNPAYPTGFQELKGEMQIPQGIYSG